MKVLCEFYEKCLAKEADEICWHSKPHGFSAHSCGGIARCEEEGKCQCYEIILKKEE